MSEMVEVVDDGEKQAPSGHRISIVIGWSFRTAPPQAPKYLE